MGFAARRKLPVAFATWSYQFLLPCIFCRCGEMIFFVVRDWVSFCDEFYEAEEEKSLQSS